MRRIHTYFIIIALVTGAVNRGLSQEVATPLSMQACMDYALQHNYNIKNSQLDVLIQDAQNKQTLAAAYPHINGKAELDDYLNPQKTFIDASSFPGSTAPEGTIIGFPFAIPYAGTASVSASQLLFDGSVFVAVKARNTLIELSKLNGAVTEETIRYNVYKAYNSLVITYRQYDIIKQSLSFARSLEHDMMVTRDNGLAEKIDVERTSVQVNNLASDSISIGNLLTTSEQMLKYQIGMNLNTPIILTDTALEERKQNTISLLNEAEDYDKVPEYNVLKTSLKLNEYNLMRYHYAGLPALNIFGAMGYNYAADKFSQIMNPTNYAFNSMVGLQLNVAIFNGFLRQNQVTEAKLNIEKSKNSIEYLKQSLDFQAATSRTTVKNNLLQVQSQKRNMELATDVLELAQKKYKAGVGSNLEVTQAQTDLLRAQTNYFSALLDLINAQADLKKALGLLK